jgi:hypothetical protein
LVAARLQPVSVCCHCIHFARALRVLPIIPLDIGLRHSILTFKIVHPGVRTFRPLFLIIMLVRANKRRFDDSGRIFVPLDFVSDMPAMDLDTGEQRGIGNVTLTLQGNSIAAIRFLHPWPQTERWQCSNFLPDYIRLPLAGVPAPTRHRTIALMVACAPGDRCRFPHSD